MTINMTWINTDLFELIATIESGSRPKGGVSVDTGEVPSLGGENILQVGGITLENVKKVPQAFYERMTKGWLRDCDVLINKDGANTGKVGFFRWGSDVPACINEHVFLLRGKTDRLTQEYLYYTLLSDHGQKIIRNRISGSAQPGLKTGFIKDFPVALPKTTDEQTNIAAILATIEKAIEQTEAIIAKQTRIKTGLMQDLLTRGIDVHGNIRSEAVHQFKESLLGQIPVEWDARELKDVALIIDPNPSHRYPPTVPDGVPIISTENFVGEDGYDCSKAECVPASVFLKQNERCRFSEDDIVFARKGRLGLSRPYGLEQKVFSHTVVIIKPRGDDVTPRYLLWILRFWDFFAQIDKRMNSNVGVPTLGVEFLGTVPVRMPERDEQVRICETLDATAFAVGLEINRLEKLRRLKSGLMQDLLNGKVRVTKLLNMKLATGIA